MTATMPTAKIRKAVTLDRVVPRASTDKIPNKTSMSPTGVSEGDEAVREGAVSRIRTGPSATYQMSTAPAMNTVPVSSSSRARSGPDRRRAGNAMRPQAVKTLQPAYIAWTQDGAVGAQHDLIHEPQQVAGHEAEGCQEDQPPRPAGTAPQVRAPRHPPGEQRHVPVQGQEHQGADQHLMLAPAPAEHQPQAVGRQHRRRGRQSATAYRLHGAPDCPDRAVSDAAGLPAAEPKPGVQPRRQAIGFEHRPGSALAHDGWPRRVPPRSSMMTSAGFASHRIDDRGCPSAHGYGADTKTGFRLAGMPEVEPAPSVNGG